jgi:exodeoxyribonuclease VII small subunit
MSEKQTFEQAYSRLEQILEKMNGDKVSLDDALSLYEEADTLIQACQKRLTEAEQKIEILVKNREGEVLVQEGVPQTETFNPTQTSTFARH